MGGWGACTQLHTLLLFGLLKFVQGGVQLYVRGLGFRLCLRAFVTRLYLCAQLWIASHNHRHSVSGHIIITRLLSVDACCCPLAVGGRSSQHVPGSISRICVLCWQHQKNTCLLQRYICVSAAGLYAAYITTTSNIIIQCVSTNIPSGVPTTPHLIRCVRIV